MNYVFKTGINYNEEPRPEYAPKKKVTNKAPRAPPPIVATTHNGIRLMSFILIFFLKESLNKNLKWILDPYFPRSRKSRYVLLYHVKFN